MTYPVELTILEEVVRRRYRVHDAILETRKLPGTGRQRSGSCHSAADLDPFERVIDSTHNRAPTPKSAPRVIVNCPVGAIAPSRRKRFETRGFNDVEHLHELADIGDRPEWHR